MPGVTTLRAVAPGDEGLGLVKNSTRHAIQASRLENGTRCPIMFHLAYGCEPVFFRGANRSPSLCPQPISHDSYAIFAWRKLVGVSHGCTEIRRHRAPFVLSEMALKVARPKQTGTASGEEDGTTAACFAAHF
jgi:hypothetical protein